MEYPAELIVEAEGFTSTVIPPTNEEMIYARGIQNELTKARGRNGTLIDYPENVTEILSRAQTHTDEFYAYTRESTALIPQAMLREGEPLTMDGIMQMLHMYYWWEESWQTPNFCIEELLKDLDDARFIEAIRVLHDTFADSCAILLYNDDESGNEAEDMERCTRDGHECFRAYLAEHVREAVLPYDWSIRNLDVSAVTSWLEPLLEDTDEESDDDQSQRQTLIGMLGDYAIRALTQAGIDPIEAGYVANVMQREEDRRWQLTGLFEDYATYRHAGGDFESALTNYFPNMLVRPEHFSLVTVSYEDLPADANNWQTEKKLALARRFIQEQRDHYYQLEDDYLLEHSGFSPFYRRAFAEDFWPPEQRV